MSEIAAPPPIPVAELNLPQDIAKTAPTFRDLIIALAVVWCSSILIQIAGAGIFIAVGLVRTGAIPNIQEADHLLLSFAILDWIVALPIVYYFNCVRFKRTFRAAFALNRISSQAILRNVAVGVSGAAIAAAIMTYLGTGKAPIYDIATNEGENGSTTLAVSFMLFAVLIPPMEELYYRGFIFPILRRSLSPIWAIVIIATWFSLLHAFQLWGEWAGLAVVILMGTLWTIQRHVYDSLTPCIISHWTYNFSLIVMQVLLG